MGQVSCLGILVADVVGRPIDAVPERGKLMSVDRIELHTGGCAANTAVGLARLGVKAIRDPHHTPTSATMVMVESSGERSFIHCPGANATYAQSDVNWEVVDAAPILHIAGPFLMPGFIGKPCADVLCEAKSRGKTITLDTVWDFTGRWMDVLAPSLPYIDYALPSIDEARCITGRDDVRDMAQVFLDHGVKVVGIKQGAEGAYVRTASGDEINAKPFPVKAIDALGAGDAWAAGFLTGLVHGWDLERCAIFANAVGATCVQALGATTGVRSFEETCRIAFGDGSCKAGR